MTTLANFPLFILFYAVSLLWARAAIYTGITIGIAKARYLLYYAADPRPRTAIIWGVLMWLIFATASPCGWIPTWPKCTSIETSTRAWHPTLKTPLMRGFSVGHALAHSEWQRHTVQLDFAVAVFNFEAVFAVAEGDKHRASAFDHRG